MKHIRTNKGYTLLELVIAIAIGAMIIYVVGSSFYKLIATQAFDKDYISVSSLVDQAKSLALNSKLASPYGVYFSSSTAVMFKGDNYVSTSTNNQVYVLNSRVSISSLNLIGSTTDRVIFSHLTGYASASGTISVSLKDGSANARVIKIYQTGIIEYK